MKTSARSLVVVLAAALLASPVVPARAERTITFYGSGWGHGVGLSQWGAYGLAQRGWDANRILTHFYSGTRIARAGHRPERIRVGILQGRRRVHLTALGGPVGIRVGSVTGWRIGRIPSGSTWTVGVHAGRYRVRDPSGALVGGREWGAPTTHLFVRYADVGSAVHVAETGHAYKRGWIEVGQHACHCRLRLVVVVAPERYLYGVSEVPTNWPQAALQAQADAARTYAFERVRRLGQHREGCDCGLWGSTNDQVYTGWDRETESGGGRWRAAVEHTRAHVITYGGHLIQAYFHSSSGGHTESNANVWGGSQLPYLRGVCDPGDFTPGNPNRTWSKTLGAKTIGARLSRATGKALGAVTRFRYTARTQAGRVLATTAVGTAGSARVTGRQLEDALGLIGTKVWIDTNRNVVDPLRARYDALGCKPGLALAAMHSVRGGVLQRFAGGTLYRNAARDRTLWVTGTIDAAYRNRGGPGGGLGMPTTDSERLLHLTGCKRSRCLRGLFEHGGIYSKPGPGLHSINGRVFVAYLLHGGTQKLGFPTSGIRRDADGTRWATFERGSIHCRNGHCRVRSTG